jgi:hypothetical protein
MDVGGGEYSGASPGAHGAAGASPGARAPHDVSASRQRLIYALVQDAGSNELEYVLTAVSGQDDTLAVTVSQLSGDSVYLRLPRGCTIAEVRRAVRSELPAMAPGAEFFRSGSEQRLEESHTVATGPTTIFMVCGAVDVSGKWLATNGNVRRPLTFGYRWRMTGPGSFTGGQISFDGGVVHYDVHGLLCVDQGGDAWRITWTCEVDGDKQVVCTGKLHSDRDHITNGIYFENSGKQLGVFTACRQQTEEDEVEVAEAEDSSVSATSGSDEAASALPGGVNIAGEWLATSTCLDENTGKHATFEYTWYSTSPCSFEGRQRTCAGRPVDFDVVGMLCGRSGRKVVWTCDSGAIICTGVVDVDGVKISDGTYFTNAGDKLGDFTACRQG